MFSPERSMNHPSIGTALNGGRSQGMIGSDVRTLPRAPCRYSAFRSARKKRSSLKGIIYQLRVSVLVWSHKDITVWERNVTRISQDARAEAMPRSHFQHLTVYSAPPSVGSCVARYRAQEKKGRARYNSVICRAVRPVRCTSVL